MGLGEGQGAASLGECWSTDPDLANRDPNNLNDHLAVSIYLRRFLKFQKKLKDYFSAHNADCKHYVATTKLL